MRSAGVYFPGLSARGGAERLALKLALSLSNRGWDACVLTDVDVDPVQLTSDLGEDVSRLTFVTLPRAPFNAALPDELFMTWSRWTHAREIRSMDLDLFVNARFKSEMPGCGKRNIYYCHFPHRLDQHVGTGVRGLYLSLMRSVNRHLVDENGGGFLGTYDEIWCNSCFTQKHIVERWGVDSRVLYPPCTMIPPGPKEPLIAVVGRFQAFTQDSPYKSQDTLLEAFSGLGDLHRSGWRMVMAGGLAGISADIQYFDQLAREAEGLPVTLMANPQFEEIRDLYARASLYWHGQGYGTSAEEQPQTQEHFGITTVEAMSAGAIPLVYATAGPLEVVEGVPNLRPWHTLGDLSSQTRTWAAAADREMREMRSQCEARARDFDEEAFQHRLAELLEQSER